MNPIQKKILILGLLALAVLGMFPPWHETATNDIDFGRSGQGLGHHFILSPPTTITPVTATVPWVGRTIDYTRLATLGLVIALVTATAFWFSRSPVRDDSARPIEAS